MVATDIRLPSPTVRLLISCTISYEAAKDIGRAVTVCKLVINKAYIASPAACCSADKAMPAEDLLTGADMQAASKYLC